MRRIHVKMIQFGIFFVLVAGIGVFGAVYVLGGMGNFSRSVSCCIDQGD